MTPDPTKPFRVVQILDDAHTTHELLSCHTTEDEALKALEKAQETKSDLQVWHVSEEAIDQLWP